MFSSSSFKIKYLWHIMQDIGIISILEKLRKQDNPFWAVDECYTSVIASVAAGGLVLPEEFKFSDMVLVWPTTVLPRSRLMLILSQMLSAELDRLLLLTLVLEVTPSDMLSLDRRDSLSDLQPRLWVCPKRGAQAYHHLQHHHRGWQILFTNICKYVITRRISVQVALPNMHNIIKNCWEHGQV